MGKKKVLIIDDEVDFCLLMQFYLSKKNCDVSISHTLHDGLGSVQTNTPDIVILDNNLPDGLGWEKMNYLTEEYPLCKINLISAYKYVLPEISGLTSVRILEKPLSLNSLKNYL